MIMPKLLLPVIFINPLTYMTAAFRFVSLQMESMPDAALVKSGVAFDIHGFIITPLMSTGIIIIMGSIFFALCVNRFSSADFSKIKIFRHGHR
jgi:ABC-2 type transport system permease protein